MKIPSVNSLYVIGLLAALSMPASATVAILSLTPSPASPQVIGTTITWTATASDTHAGPLTFRTYITPPGGKALMVRDFLPGTLSSGTWTSVPFTWLPTACNNIMSAGVDAFTCAPIEGVYSIEVVAKDFTSAESATKKVNFQVTPLVTGSTPVVAPSANPLVSFFAAPACATGSSIRVSFQEVTGGAPATTTNWMTCHPKVTSNFEIAGVHPNTAYKIFAQTASGGKVVNGPSQTYQTGSLPASITFPTFTSLANSNSDTALPVIIHNLIQLGSGTIYPDVATDLAGNIIWYYYPNDTLHADTLTRPLQNGTFLSIENGSAWNPAATAGQYLRQVDLAGNVIRETNTGVLQQELLALGATDAQACNAVPKPAPVGSACLGDFNHDAIQTLPPTVNSTLPGPFTAVIADIEKIFPPGTQGNNTGLPVDILGDMIIVLDSNWNVVWYFDAFQHDGGCPVPPATGPCQLDINRPAVLGETCGGNTSGCPEGLLLGPGIAPLANDWLHANSLYYWPSNFGGASNDIIWSSRHQDWVMKVDYENGSPSATGEILWRMGNQGDFTWAGPTDPWPWFSHQHEVGIETNGTGVMTVFDNGNTRIAPPPIGVGGSPGCQPYDCNSRGMALNFSEQTMDVTAALSSDLGYFSAAMGSAQLLSNGDYFFQPAIVLTPQLTTAGYSIEVAPVPATDLPTVLLNLEGPEHYRAWQVTSMYFPPIT
jgi:arylsulfate sulfotransferase